MLELTRSLKRTRGWTLTELLMVLATMAILAALTWPSYTQYVHRGYRAEARSALLEAQHFMERHYTAHGRYSAAGTWGSSAMAPALPQRLQRIPNQSTRYVLSVSQVSADSYTLSATPTGSMATDKCAALTLSHTSVRSTTSLVATAAECWR